MLPQKIFAKSPRFLETLKHLPHLAEIQIKSYEWFLKEGLRELFYEISPVKDYTGKELELYFEDYYFDQPKFNEIESQEKNLTYEAALRVKLKLVNKKTNETKIQEVYFGEIPMMTSRGTFIVNGVERTVVSQIIRSSGLYLTAIQARGRKLFGAKLIPNRGSWLEFETDLDSAIYVKIDRKRKVPATCLLRIFGLDTNEAILKTFADVDNGKIKYIEKTLAKDIAKTKEDSYVEIYRRIRPGDLATPDNAKSLIDGMFFREDRYDLGEVGRFKLNQRLNRKPDEIKERTLTLKDLVEVVKLIISSNNNDLAEPDDIDHLSNRRVRPVGELLQNRLRVGIMRLRRTIQERMSTLDIYNLVPAQLINARQMMAVVWEFFSTSQLSQFLAQENPLAELEHKRRLSAMGPGGLHRKRAGFEVRDVHPTHYGRICPIQTPEGQNVGLVTYLSTFARLNRLGFIETPYFKVKKGHITDEIIYLDAYEEERYHIAHSNVNIDKNGKIVDEMVEARYRGEPGFYRRDEIDLIDVSPFQILSVATSLIPFLEHDDANRAQMGSNMQRQAVSYMYSEAPLVSTGLEAKAARDSGHVLVSDVDGEVVEVDGRHIKIKVKGTNNYKVYTLRTFVRANQYTCISQRPIVKKGQKIHKGDVLADSLQTKDGMLALGKNLLVAFISWGGANYEDAVILSERVVQNDLFTSIHIEDFVCDVRETKLGPEITTLDIPNVSLEKLKDLDEEGIVRIGAEVRSGDILVGKISPKGEGELTAEERLLRAIFGEKARDVKDTSLILKHGKRGRVVGIKIFSRDRGDKLEPGIIKRIQIEVAQRRLIRAGDKLAGRHGNKGVISKIVPVEDMPYLEDGTPVDIILNPLGVASRMNLGQILETHLGWAAHELGYQAIVPVFSGTTEEDIKKELKTAGLPEDGKVILYDGRTGEPFENRVMVGYIYMMKLVHMVEDKVHMRSIGPYSLITQQPLGGKAQLGGQRFGEMEVWALEGYGAAYTLQEMLTIKSDDIKGRISTYESIVRGQEFKSPNIPASFHVLVNELKSLALNIELIGVKEKSKTVEEKEEEGKLFSEAMEENKYLENNQGQSQQSKEE
ncbi:MAG: DNA-directed RNA polymerase subunit beta [Patescibacteria group bacterium]|nr:DNA-directed RNA polymerase subunit beta [Patescibacteria group bacterium]